MGKISLLDCTLRDGGYVNNWHFGENTIKGFCKKIAQTGVEICEVGFIKGETYNDDVSVFPDTDTFKKVITPNSNMIQSLPFSEYAIVPPNYDLHLKRGCCTWFCTAAPFALRHPADGKVLISGSRK